MQGDSQSPYTPSHQGGVQAIAVNLQQGEQGAPREHQTPSKTARAWHQDRDKLLVMAYWVFSAQRMLEEGIPLSVGTSHYHEHISLR